MEPELNQLVPNEFGDTKLPKLSFLSRNLKDDWGPSTWPSIKLLITIPYRLVQAVLRPLVKLRQAECDYVREAEAARRFRELLADETDVFTVPKIIDEASGKQVLTMERMRGIAVTKIQDLSQEQRDWIGTQILRLCLPIEFHLYPRVPQQYQVP